LGTDRPLLVDGDITEQADWLSQESSRLQAEECQILKVIASYERMTQTTLRGRLAVTSIKSRNCVVIIN
jgi:hypothetical protein